MSKKYLRFLSYGLAMTFLVISLLSFQFYYNNQSITSINQAIKSSPTSAGESSFLQFDATQFVENHLWLGNKVVVIYESQLLGNSDNKDRAPNETKIKQVLSNYQKQDRLILAPQSWSIMTGGKVDPKAKEHIEWYLQILDWAHQVLPQTKIGFVVSTNDLADDGLSLFKSVIQASDAFYPSFDVSSDDIDHVLFIMTDALLISKSLQKPVYPFMWHKGSGGNYLGKLLPDSVIEQQCKLIRSNADGVVWWSGAGETWSGGTWYPAASECFR